MVIPIDDLVSVFFVGPGKCGTSSLFSMCRAHELLNTGLVKEPGEFLTRDVNLAAYHKLWRGPGIRCDFSNTYFFSDIAAEGIRRYNPSAKICITIRDPLSRLVSQYMFMCRNGRFSGSISDAIAKQPHIVDRCRYHKHAHRWLERFTPERILILRLETLQSDPDRYRTELFDYLGVPDSIDMSSIEDNRLQAAEPRSRLLARGTKELAEIARKVRLFRLLEWVKRSSLVGILYRPLPGSYQQDHLHSIPDDVRNELEEEYQKFLSIEPRYGNVRVV